jgi:hypothetical protein
LTSEPDYVIIYLGNNDGKKLTWEGSGEKSFISNYNALIDMYEGLPSKPKVLLVNTPAILKCFKGFNSDAFHQKDVINVVTKKAITDIAKERKLGLIDLYKGLGGLGGPDEDKWCTQIKDNGQTPDGFHYGYKAQAEIMAKFLDDELNGKNKVADTSAKEAPSVKGTTKEEKKVTTKEEKSEKKVTKSINGKKESDGESKKKKVIKSVHRDDRFGKKTKDANSTEDASSPSNNDDDILDGVHQPIFISKKQAEKS